MANYNNIESELVHSYIKSNGVKVKEHYRQGKNFMQNKWIGVPKRIRRRDPEFIQYNQWRIEMGMTDLFWLLHFS